MQDRKKKDQVNQEIALIVRVQFPDDPVELDPLEEIQGLAETAGAIVMAGIVQRRDKPDPTTYIGKGKVAELKELVDFHAADVVLFDNNLSPAQNRNLELELKVKVLDRTEVILDIFATHARTLEARLAVELAQLQYALPRLKRMWTHLSRLKMGVGMRGPGEKQLETDRRLVEKRIHDLKDELKKVELRKERQVRSRKGTMTCSLVGYTNAGKSTLMNALTDADVLAQDKLFATLDTRTRRWHLPQWGPILLSDTVGFIRDLPHALIASFKATLEETRQADLLLHVADASNPKVIDQIMSVYDVLEEIGIKEKDALLVLNKSDVARDMPHFNSLLNRYPNAIAVSAKTKEGFDRLHSVVGDALSRSFQDVDIEMSVGNGKLLAYLAAKGEIVSTQYREDVVLVHCRIPQKYLGRIDYDNAIVTPHNAAGWVSEEGDAEIEGEVTGDGGTVEHSTTEQAESALPTAPAEPVETPIAPIEAPRD
ncbi:GTPase HflX [Mariniblastus fucicola]|uniref:GTPase HflX n=1 Tax=Mariniblastus fucicola TaxID=980251 RepID=A0A5B9PEY3_9BACT|nr:GTPase HflX [Mariniblastus fucicola]QEG23176.1 GTPase HflX [Mariniblastus fucicola]